ncbi:hypothetical protein L210DRAFT_3568323 [Boletus edulis BED1]|uniref:Uncharacterized protein n=1 Tax=Boletus edulis BED1 TaxID=1328754 RepID=A0AAD4BEN2_BOLED|nr:hypothetical protein L210DRAFT_3568323 [Boletus edulis BED1]
MIQPDQVLRQDKGAPMEEHWAEKRRWEERDGQMQELMEMVSRLLDEQAAAREREEEQRQEFSRLLDEQAAAREREEEQRQAGGGTAVMGLLNTLSNDSTRQHEETINAIRAIANKQAPYNIQGYLDKFSKALATEVRMLMGEVGKLHEEHLSIQHDLEYLMTMKSKYGPGGEFDPESKSRVTFSALHPRFPPSPDLPPLPMPPARPSDLPTVEQLPSLSPRKRQEAQAPPPEPIPEPRQVHSWVTWQPNPALSPAPPSVEPTQLLPDSGSPGLFGHTNRRDDSSPEPVPAPRRDSGITWPWKSPTASPSESSSPGPILLVPDRRSPGLFGPRSPRESD